MKRFLLGGSRFLLIFVILLALLSLITFAQNQSLVLISVSRTTLAPGELFRIDVAHNTRVPLERAIPIRIYLKKENVTYSQLRVNLEPGSSRSYLVRAPYSEGTYSLVWYAPGYGEVSTGITLEVKAVVRLKGRVESTLVMTLINRSPRRKFVALDMSLWDDFKRSNVSIGYGIFGEFRGGEPIASPGLTYVNGKPGYWLEPYEKRTIFVKFVKELPEVEVTPELIGQGLQTIALTKYDVWTPTEIDYRELASKEPDIDIDMIYQSFKVTIRNAGTTLAMLFVSAPYVVKEAALMYAEPYPDNEKLLTFLKPMTLEPGEESIPLNITGFTIQVRDWGEMSFVDLRSGPSLVDIMNPEWRRLVDLTAPSLSDLETVKPVWYIVLPPSSHITLRYSYAWSEHVRLRGIELPSIRAISLFSPDWLDWYLRG